MNSILLLAFKDLKLLFRDKGAVFWTFAFPLIFAALFGAMFSGIGGSNNRSNIQVAVVDEAGTDASGKFLEKLKAHQSITLEAMSREDAESAVRLRNKTAFVIIHKKAELEESGSETSSPKYTIGIDPSRQAETGMLQGILFQAALPFPAPGTSPEGESSFPQIPGMPGKDEIKVVDIARRARSTDQLSSAYQITFPAAILWGVMSCVAGFAISFVRERTRGTHLRLLISPLSHFTTVAGKSLACLLSSMIIAITLLIFAKLVFGVHVESPGLLALALLSTSFCFTGLMMLLGSLAKTEEAVNGAGWGIMTLFAMLGGGMMPLVFFPAWLVPFSHASPVKWGIYSLEGAIWRGFTMSEMILPVGILVGLGAVSFFLAMRVQKKMVI
jgi:ABC-2 type transport system permease protein